MHLSGPFFWDVANIRGERDRSECERPHLPVGVGQVPKPFESSRCWLP